MITINGLILTKEIEPDIPQVNCVSRQVNLTSPAHQELLSNLVFRAIVMRWPDQVLMA